MKAKDAILGAGAWFIFGVLMTLLLNSYPVASAGCWNGSGACVRTDGTRSGNDVWVQARDAGVAILATDQDTHDNGLANALEEALNINGENAAAANISWGSNKITSLSVGAATTDSINLLQAQGATYQWGGTSTGTNLVAFGVSPTLTAYVTGGVFRFLKSSNVNTAIPSININSVGAITVVGRDGSGLEAGDMPADALLEVLYDGTNFRLMSVSEGDAVTNLHTTAATTSGTTVDITTIPAGTCRIAVSLKGVSTDGTEDLLFQIGPTGGITTSGYDSRSTQLDASSEDVTNTDETTGFVVTSGAASKSIDGHMLLTHMSSNIWVSSHTVTEVGADGSSLGAGQVTLAGVITQIRATSTGTPDDFDAGSYGILTEPCS